MLFFHLPTEWQLRATTPYNEIFALTLFWNVGLLGIVIVFLFLIFFILKQYQIKMNKNPQNRIRQSLLSQQSRQQSKRISQQQNFSSENNNQIINFIQNPITKRFIISNFLTSFFFYFFWLNISLIYLTFYMFGYMGRGLSHDILTVFIMTLIVVIPTLIWKNNTKIKKIKLIKNQVIFTVICLFVWLGISIFGVITLKGACLCYYNDKYGFSVGNQMGPFLSTQWTRTNAIQKICNENQVCNLYATLPQDTATQVFINVHTGMNLQNITIKLTNSQTNQEKAINITEHIKLANVQDIGKRFVHSALFSNLTGETIYRLEVYKTPASGQSYGSALKKSNYRTLPNKGSQQVKMAVGGDVSMTQEGKMITEKLISFDPDVIIIGGDNTYDDGMRTCYYSWDNFYQIFDDLNTKLNRTVPIIMSVGNHDVGFDSMASSEISRQEDQIPLYFLYNPQHTSIDPKKTIPDIKDRSTVHYHIIGPTVHLHLDSGYVIPFDNQMSKIQSVGQKFKQYYLFSNYHNPIYPSCTDMTQGSNDLYVIRNATKYWTPFFDKYNFVAGFEHHTHHKKFTKKIKNGVESGNGTRYVGDGSWGVIEGNCASQKINPSKLIEFSDTKEPNHVWLVTVTSKNEKNYTINYTAIDILGNMNFTMVEPLTQLV